MARAFHHSELLTRTSAAVEQPEPAPPPARVLPAFYPGQFRQEPTPPPRAKIVSLPEEPEMSYNPASFGYAPTNMVSNSFLGGAGSTIATGALSALLNRYVGTGSTAGNAIAEQPTRAQLGAPAPRRRRRRRKLLTASDKSDIAFLHGQLGSGALGRAAISSLLSRRC